MKISIYPFVKRPESYYYEFYIEGPKGRIKKVVEHYRLQEMETDVFNLAFGDWDEKKNHINDLSISNNADKDKVLATVGATVTDFMKEHPNAIIIAVGSTTSRTRLYQMGISKALVEVNKGFEIQGYLGETWQPFQIGVNYVRSSLKPNNIL